MISGVNLIKRFGDTTAVNGVSFMASPGQVTALLGPNGSGKSTLFRLLVGASRADGGRVLLNGRALEEYSHLSGVVGSYLDGVGVHPRWRVEDQLGIVAELMEVKTDRIETVIEECGLSGFRRLRGRELSVGMRQRVGIALSLLSDPACLILDEPANGLDPSSLRWLRNFMKERANAGYTIILSSHLMAEVEQVADHVTMLHRGAVVWDSSMSQFKDSHSKKVVIVEGYGLESLLASLLRRDIRVESVDNELRVYDLNRESVGLLAHSVGCVVTGLRSETPVLEDLYLDFLARLDDSMGEGGSSSVETCGQS